MSHDEQSKGLSETDAHMAIYERGRQAGYREGIEAARLYLQGYAIQAQHDGDLELEQHWLTISRRVRQLLPATTPETEET